MFDPADSPVRINKGPLTAFLGWVIVSVAAGFFLGSHFGGHIR